MPKKKNGFDLADIEGSSDDNNWEPEENVEPGYEDAQKKGGVEALDESLASRKRGRRKKRAIEEIEKPRGVDRGLQPEKILAAQLSDNILYFLVKWQGCTDFDVVPAKDLNQHYPDFVIEYYESCVPFSIRHKVGKTPRIAPELPPEPEPEAPMEVSSENLPNLQQDQTAESTLLNTEEPAPPAEPQEMPQEQMQHESQPMEVPVN